MLIGLVGPMGVGKTTLADAVVHYMPRFRRVMFAYTLRAMLQAIGLTWEDVTTYKDQPHGYLSGRTPREALQTFGEAGRTGIDHDIWVNATMRDVQEHLTRGDNVIIDDVRYRNEADAIRRMGGVVVRLHRDEHTPRTDAASRHVSETNSALIIPSMHYTIKGVPSEALVHDLMHAIYQHNAPTYDGY